MGRRIERWSTRQALREKLQREQAEMRELGIEYSPKDLQDEPFRPLNLNFDTAYRTLLVQREKRARTLANLERQAEQSSVSSIPNVLFVPQTAHWIPPRPRSFPDFEKVSFDNEEQRQAILDWCPNVEQAHDRMSPIDRIHLWSLCVVYYFGGEFVGDRLQSPLSDARDHSNTTEAQIALSQNRIGRLAAPPRHPILKFFLQHIAQSNHITSITSVFSTWLGSGRIRLLCTSNSPSGCLNVTVMDSRSDNKGAWNTSILLSEISSLPETAEPPDSIKVSISKPTFEDVKATKHSIETVLQEQGKRPSWVCMRCLMMPTFGRLSKCTQYCNSNFVDLVCTAPHNDRIEKVYVDIHGNSRPDLVHIPKIVHQTWFEEVTLDRYPQLARVQNSWKQSGWEYRLYTDSGAKRYILDNFPPIFAEAFEALLPGAYKADFFRYLVLMKEGGIYSDVDILLETNLDNFVRPGLSFFVPRDVVGECVDEAFCLWNGLIGAVPGHPILVRAVERLVNHILRRADVHDMQREICREDHDSETWKVYTHPILFLSGPCALGVAMNEALGRPSLSAIDTGWLSLEIPDNNRGITDYGDALILILDKHDLGGFRFSDPERNIIVASTELGGLEKSPRDIANPSRAERQHQKERDNHLHGHYSKAGHGSLVWGSQGIYKDQLVSNIQVHFTVDYV